MRLAKFPTVLQLLETYRHLLAGVDTAQTMQGRRSVDAIDGLIRSATSGMQMMNAASISLSSISERRPSGDSVISADLGSTPSDVGQKRSVRHSRRDIANVLTIV